MKTLCYRLAADLVGMPLTSEQLESLAGAPTCEGHGPHDGTYVDNASTSSSHDVSSEARSMLKRGCLRHPSLNGIQSSLALFTQASEGMSNALVVHPGTSTMTAQLGNKGSMATRAHKCAVPMVDVGGEGFTKLEVHPEAGCAVRRSGLVDDDPNHGPTKGRPPSPADDGSSEDSGGISSALHEAPSSLHKTIHGIRGRGSRTPWFGCCFGRLPRQ